MFPAGRDHGSIEVGTPSGRPIDELIRSHHSPRRSSLREGRDENECSAPPREWELSHREICAQRGEQKRGSRPPDGAVCPRRGCHRAADPEFLRDARPDARQARGVEPSFGGECAPAAMHVSRRAAMRCVRRASAHVNNPPRSFFPLPVVLFSQPPRVASRTSP